MISSSASRPKKKAASASVYGRRPRYGDGGSPCHGGLGDGLGDGGLGDGGLGHEPACSAIRSSRAALRSSMYSSRSTLTILTFRFSQKACSMASTSF